MLSAINISAREAAGIRELPNNTVLISINNSLDPLFTLQLDRQSSKVLTVVFDDITAPKQFEGTDLKVMDGDDTVKILDFINIHKDKNFIIHCAAGISRSAAVALFISRYYGHTLKDRYWSICHPNYYILGRLISCKEYGKHLDVHNVLVGLPEEDRKILRIN